MGFNYLLNTNIRTDNKAPNIRNKTSLKITKPKTPIDNTIEYPKEKDFFSLFFYVWLYFFKFGIGDSF